MTRCPPSPQSKLMLTPAGFYLTPPLASLLQEEGYHITPYYFHTLYAHPSFSYLEAGQHLLYLPSILGIWALQQQAWIEKNFIGLITDGALKPHTHALQWIKIRLKWEQARLGSDAVSFFMQQCLVQAGTSCDFANLTIKNWLSLFCHPPLQPLFAQDYVVDFIQAHDMKEWLVQRTALVWLEKLA